MAATSPASCATASCAESPLFPVAAADAASGALPANSSDGGEASAARQPAPLQAASVAAAKRAAPLYVPPLLSAPRHRRGRVRGRRNGRHLALPPPHWPQR